MPITHSQIRSDFNNYWKELPRLHKHLDPAPLILKDDSSTLFTGSGMQQLISHLMGEKHALGQRLYNTQPCLRSQDIPEVGDNRHTTFVEMMGNWSLGDYFKKEQLEWVLNYFTKIVGLDEKNLYVTVFQGTKDVPKDTESYELWKKLGFPEERIFEYGTDHNWWSRFGDPSHMPDGEIGGPDSEVFYDFGEDLKIHEKSNFSKSKCHPNCECGRFLEIGNSVFMQYIKKNGQLKELRQKNVDYGGGLERISAAANNTPDVFGTDLYSGIIDEIEQSTGKKYSDEKYKGSIRIIADHLKASVFLIVAGVEPSNKEQGYILRRLLRRSAVKMHQLNAGLTPIFSSILDRGILSTYDGFQGIDRHKQKNYVDSVVEKEINKFSITLDKGLKEIEKLDEIKGKNAFDLFQSYGFPIEITEEFAIVKGKTINKVEFHKQFNFELQKHQESSRKSSKTRFGH